MIRVANAPCSWGVLEFEGMGESYPYDRVLDEIAATGYIGSELGDWGFMPTESSRLREEFDRRGLSLLGAFVPVFMADASTHDEGIRIAVRTARLLAQASTVSPVIVLADDNGRDAHRTAQAGRIRRDDSLDEARWKTFAAGATAIARAVKDETGLRTVFHPHCAGFVETPWEVDELLQRTPPDLLGLCFDSGHLLYGGTADPVETLRRHRDRVWHVHVKDCSAEVAARARAEQWDYFAAVRQGIFCELGKGAVDLAAVVAALTGTAYDGWVVVEQDVLPGMGAPADSARRNREVLRTLGL
ncbi:MAG: TIM barrel protein [Acidobacteria bacterium]|jgi:inosose dehydratase|nr:TIM barrel protein [Acidobacteriota bacterium]